MEDKTKLFGKMGEDSAAAFLCGKGFRIIERNARVGHLEIDIVAEKDGTVAFTEVKTRSEYPGSDSRFSRPCFAVTRSKQEKLIAAAREYMRRDTSLSDHPFRIEIVEVYIQPKCDKYKVLKIYHMPNSVNP